MLLQLHFAAYWLSWLHTSKISNYRYNYLEIQFGDRHYIIWNKNAYNFLLPKKYDILKRVVTGCRIWRRYFWRNSHFNIFCKNGGLRRVPILDSIRQLDHACIFIRVILLGPGEHCLLIATFGNLASFPRSWVQYSWWLTRTQMSLSSLKGPMESSIELPMN